VTAADVSTPQDDIQSNASTFFVEMKEMASISTGVTEVLLTPFLKEILKT
jgi:DNA mismatch repair ATPase MutS